MAKSFYNILADREIEVNHDGETVWLQLPEWLTECAEFLEDEEKMLEWAQEHEIVLALFHSGIQQLIIALRAAARPNDKDGKKVSILGEEKAAAQLRVLEYVFKAVSRPGTKKVKQSDIDACKISVNAMKKTGLDNAVVHAGLDPAYGKALVAKTINDWEMINE